MKKMILGAIGLLLAGCRSSSVPEEPLPLTLQAPHAQEMIVPPPLELGKLDLPEEPLPSAVIDRIQTAQNLLEYQAGTKIDTYFYYMNRWYREQQAVFILDKRIYLPRVQDDGTYLLTCLTKAHTGVDKAHIRALNFPCGVWKVDVGLQIVLPHDKKAEDIWAE